MYSCCNDAPGCTGFPHSGIVGCCGSYHLTDAYRRLARPSSPLTAWASTVYASSLNLTTHRRLVRRCGHKRDANTPRSAPLITEGRGDVSFQFSACSGLLKSIILRSPPLPARSEVFLKPYGGAKRDRTADLLRARQALSQLSYSPIQSCRDLYYHSTECILRQGCRFAPQGEKHGRPEWT